MPHALRGWCRYSKLTFLPFSSAAALVFYEWFSALIGRDPVRFVLAAGLTVMWLVYLAWGAINAERARRYGCW